MRQVNPVDFVSGYSLCERKENMKTILKVLCSMIAIFTMMVPTVVLAGQNETDVTVLPEYGISAAPVACGDANAINPIIVAGNANPCPGGVYCEHYRCGEAFCCPWGYFYSNICEQSCPN